MTSRVSYLSILGAAIFAAATCFMKGDINFKVSASTINRYEFFAFFLYSSIVYLIYSAGTSQSAETENISLDPLRVMSFSIPLIILVCLLTMFVLVCVLITA